MRAPDGRPTAYAAVDLGASSGRVMLGFVEAGDARETGDPREPGEVRMTEVHRFANGPHPDSLRPGAVLLWDVERLFEETLVGLAAAHRAASSAGRRLVGIGVDTWGVDYGLLDVSGVFDGRVEHHRGADVAGPARAETDGPPAWTAAEIHAITGIPPQPINTSYRLRAAADAGSAGGTVLLVPDLWVHLLTGAVGAERTIASTTQLLDARTGRWSRALVESGGLEDFELPEPVEPGTLAGVTLPHITERIGAGEPVPVYRVAGHDTASALAFAQPDADQLLVSSGSWSLAGVCVNQPVLTAAALAAGFTNERGVGGSTLLLRNLAGLWLLGECVRHWSVELGRELDPVALVRQASARDDLAAPVFDVGDERLLAPGDMPARIGRLCADAGQAAPEGMLGTVRSIVESLAAAYADAARAVSSLRGTAIRSVRIVGGGARNELLCRRTAEIAGLTVIAGPAEASAFGNLAVQLVAAGEFGGLDEVYALGGTAGGEIGRFEPSGDERAVRR
ncbi:rhamnulokinase [Herbiconiux sp. P18]|uniref:rhamnulokinase n=1 Tax=Herbiconiux liangxiaofengii TaxID=3342795 RepID=UPI0035BB3ADA